MGEGDPACLHPVLVPLSCSCDLAAGLTLLLHRVPSWAGGVPAGSAPAGRNPSGVGGPHALGAGAATQVSAAHQVGEQSWAGCGCIWLGPRAGSWLANGAVTGCGRDG